MSFLKRNSIEIEIDKNTHLLVLDQKWHELFNDKKPSRIKTIEKEVNDLLKKQGTYNTELKEYSTLKKKMMDEIVESMKEAYDDKDKTALKQMEKNKKYIDQINKKLEHHQKELTDIPEKISEANKKLVNATMKNFYHTMIDSKKQATLLEQEVKDIKEKIKEVIIRRDEAKGLHQQLYGYIHDVVGPDIIEQYDKYYEVNKND